MTLTFLIRSSSRGDLYFSQSPVAIDFTLGVRGSAAI